MIDFSKADAHIHLFEGGYQGGSLTSRPGVEVDELLCYQSLMKDHHIEAALVVGFEGDAFCRQNNDFLAELIPYHPWIYASAYCHLDHQPDYTTVGKLENEGLSRHQPLLTQRIGLQEAIGNPGRILGVAGSE